jgi:hypothetical protein
MAGNQVTLTFGGDAEALVKAAAKSKQALDDVGTAATDAGSDMAEGSKQTDNLGTRLGHLGSTMDAASGAVDNVSGALQGFADVESAAERRAQEHARALNDLKQAQADVNQALLDGKQATLDIDQANIDAKQATLDARTAQDDYNTAVKEHGKNSVEAQQAAIDLAQANADLKQANQDVAQATSDSTQATIDAEAAQLDANEAWKEAHPPDLQKFVDQINTYAPILQGLVSIIGVVTAVQWAWNVAMDANPIGLIIAAVVILVGVIVLIATKTTWFQDLWRVAWGWIKRTAVSFWDWLKDLPAKIGSTFMKIGNFITAPFRAAFNFIADAWNNTIGSLRWTVPDWVPLIGGSTVSVPQLPHFHSGGVVPGSPGQEVLAVLQAGETVTPAGRGGGGMTLVIQSGGSKLDDAIVEIIARAVRRAGPGVINVRTA